MIRRVHGEAIALLGGGRALLMQIAHPMVARGVAEHSTFRTAPFRRLLRTLRPTLAIVFGEPEEVRAAADRINRVHSRVVGEGYSAMDPDLLFWVLATLIDSALLVHERFLRPLTRVEAEAYYKDSLRAGELLGVLPEQAPADIERFRAYMERMVGSLEVSADGKRLAREIFGPPLAWTPLGPIMRNLTAGLLPEALRAQFALDWDSDRERLLQSTAGAIQKAWPRLPAALRAHPWFLMPPSCRPWWLRNAGGTV
jgi:uncharacterized protein (DUF2236 family)